MQYNQSMPMPLRIHHLTEALLISMSWFGFQTAWGMSLINLAESVYYGGLTHVTIPLMSGIAPQIVVPAWIPVWLGVLLWTLSALALIFKFVASGIGIILEKWAKVVEAKTNRCKGMQCQYWVIAKERLEGEIE